ncbi:uncharacterized protein LOC143281680 [Babylonia areolata]|uniref:uncharacterized protein LOC143281680 n=1 Tax=Babylonia areolata TaxID=304850 RepID=UPI003FD4DF2F
MFCSAGKLCFVFGVLLACGISSTDAQVDCIVNDPDPVTFSETDPPGLALANLPGGSGATWTHSIQRPGVPSSVHLAPYFRLEQTGGNATLYLNQTLDLELVNEFLENRPTIQFEIICSQAGARPIRYTLYATVTPVNEFPPEFVRIPEGGFNISEARRVGDTILTLQDFVEDKDVVPNHAGYEFVLLNVSDASVDGRQKLSLGNILTGSLVVREPLDYEAMDPAAAFYLLNVSVGDRDGQQSPGTIIRINIIDADDQPPEFWHPNCTSTPCFAYYRAAIAEDFQGKIVGLQPAPIAARDQDTLASPVTYRLKQGYPDYFADYISIDSQTGEPYVIKPVQDTEVAEFIVIVEAVENSSLQHSQQTSLRLRVIGRNSTEPTLPPVVLTGPSTADSAFRTATIVLGVLFAILLLLLVVFVVYSVVNNDIRSGNVLPKAICKLSSDDEELGSSVGGGTASRSTRRKARKSVALSKSPGSESRLDFMRALSRRRRPSSPTLRSFHSTGGEDPAEEKHPDMQNLPVSREIDYDNEQNGVNEDENLHGDLPYPATISTISDAGVLPYEDQLGLMHRGEGLQGEEERMGMANPVYESERGHGYSVEVGVSPKDDNPVYI